MFSSSGLTTGRVLAVFTDAIAAHEGRVTDTFDDGRRLFTRAILPHVGDVRSGDQMKGGIALKATEGEVRLYPYLFRLVCRNGAIVAQTLGVESLANLDWRDPDDAEQSIRETVSALATEEVFTANLGRMRRGVDQQVDLALAMMPMLSQVSADVAGRLFGEVLERFFQDGDSSRFGLANAVTATARETRDPELRWSLEEFGGGIAVGVVPDVPVDGEHRAFARPVQLASVR